MIMQSNNYEWFITQTVESMLPRFSCHTIGLGMIVEMAWNHYSEDGENEKKFMKRWLLFFHRPHNYTKVLLKDITDDRAIGGLEGRTFDMTQVSDHDSCWRSDGMRFLFKTFCDAWKYFEQFGIEGRDIDPSVHFSIFSGGTPTYYKVNLEKDTDEQWGKIPYKVHVGGKIPMHEISQYMPVPKGK
jgi:hypothetical protein